MSQADGTSRPTSFSGDTVYRLLVENASEAIYVVQNGLILFVNPKACEMVGYTRDELHRMNITEIVHSEDRGFVMERHGLRMGGTHFNNRYVHRIVTKSKQTRWIEVNVVRVDWQDAPAVLIFATDVTERKRAEDALRESEQRYRALFYSAPAGIFYYNADLRLLEANERFMSTFAPPGISLVGMDLHRIYDRRIVPCLSDPLGGQEGKYLGGFRENRDTEECWLFINTLPVYRADGELAGGIGIFQDLTDWKRMETRLKEREVELRLKSRHLEEANTALQVILRHNEEEQAKIQSNVLANIEEMVVPLLGKIKNHQTSDRLGGYVDLIEMNLREIVSPFMRNLTINHYSLTKQEKRIASLIRRGMKTSEIASSLGLSRRSVEHHRYKIRSKLGLRHTKTNLRTLLLSLSDQ